MAIMKKNRKGLSPVCATTSLALRPNPIGPQCFQVAVTPPHRPPTELVHKTTLAIFCSVMFTFLCAAGPPTNPPPMVSDLWLVGGQGEVPLFFFFLMGQCKALTCGVHMILVLILSWCIIYPRPNVGGKVVVPIVKTPIYITHSF